MLQNLKIFFKNYGMRNFRIFLNISEKCFNSYKNYEKNFHQGYVCIIGHGELWHPSFIYAL